VKFISDRRAKWLPSRHRYALGKLIAFLVFRAQKRGITPTSTRYAFPVDDNQSAAETFLVAVWVFLTAVVEMAALLPFRPWVSAIIAVITMPWLLQIPLYVVGLIFGSRTLISMTTFTILAITSAFVAVMPMMARYVAWLFFAVLAANALAWPIAWLLREPMRALEQQCGA
jgi:hypothetical protein